MSIHLWDFAGRPGKAPSKGSTDMVRAGGSREGDAFSIVDPENWYAAYTRSRHEKSVATHLEVLGITNFLPLYSHTSHWKDRRVRLQLPLFPNYVFVRIDLALRVRVLGVPGVISMVSSKGKPIPMPQAEVERLQSSMKNGAQVEPHEYLPVGQKVRVIRGPFEGYEGVLEQKKNTTKLIVAIPQIMRAFALTVGVDEIEPIGTPFVLRNESYG